MRKFAIFLVGFVCIGVLGASPIALNTPAFFHLDPMSGFLYASSNDTEHAPEVVDLAAEGLVAGDVINLTGEGGICFLRNNFGCLEAATWIAGAFDTNSVVLGNSNQDRLPNGIASQTYGQQNISAPWLDSFYGNVDTTIPSDFTIPYGGGVTLTIPAGANFLFFGVMDSYYEDNSDPLGDLGVELTLLVDPPPPSVVPQSVATPEPATWTLLGTGLGLLGVSIGARRKTNT